MRHLAPRGTRRLELALQSPASDGPKNCSTQWSLTARLGDSFYFAVSKIVESLLRRGARGFSTNYSPSARWRKLAEQLTLFGQFPTPAIARGRAIPTSENCPQAGQAPLTPRGRCLPALGMGHPGEKTFSVRALAEIDQTTESCLIDFLLQQSRAGASRHTGGTCRKRKTISDRATPINQRKPSKPPRTGYNAPITFIICSPNPMR